MGGAGIKYSVRAGRVSRISWPKGTFLSDGEIETQSKVVAFPSSRGAELNEMQAS